MAAIEQRALVLSPDRTPVLLSCFRLQHLLSERLAIRFEYLVATDALDCDSLRSLGDIEKRLDQGWTEAEEKAIKDRNAHYCDIGREIEIIQSKWVPELLTVPLGELTKDDVYRAQSLAHASRIRELRERMARESG